jgi:hypothetical protein
MSTNTVDILIDGEHVVDLQLVVLETPKIQTKKKGEKPPILMGDETGGIRVIPPKSILID